MEGGGSQRYSRKSNEREPNEAILKGDIVGSFARRTNSITSSGIERIERRDQRERDRIAGFPANRQGGGTRERGRERERRAMHSVHRYRGGLYCRNGSVKVLRDFLLAAELLIAAYVCRHVHRRFRKIYFSGLFRGVKFFNFQRRNVFRFRRRLRTFSLHAFSGAFFWELSSRCVSIAD